MTILSSYTKHDPIDIRNDTALASFAVSGTGDLGSPYVLEGWNITNDGPNTYGIRVVGTTKYLVVRDCWLGGAGSVNSRGITIDAAASGTALVERVHCTSWYYGIEVLSSSGTAVMDSTVRNCQYGLVVASSTNCTVFNNTAFGNSEWGLYVVSPFTTVANNTLFANAHGMYINNAKNAIIENNTLVDDGFKFQMNSVADYETISERDNLVNGLPFLFLVSEKGTTYDQGSGQVIMINCTGVGLSNQNASNSETGAFLLWCTDCRVRDSHFDHNANSGLDAEYSSNITIENVTVSRNARDGFRLADSTVNITDCDLVENKQGVELLGDGVLSAHHNRFVNNTDWGLPLSQWNTKATDNNFTDDGILCQATSMESYLEYSDNVTGNLVNGRPLMFYNSVRDVTISSPHGQIFLTNCSNVVLASLDCSHTVTGITIAFCKGCSVVDSDCSFARLNGVRVWNSNFTVVQNTVCNSSSTGIAVGNSISTTLMDNHCNGDYTGIYLGGSRDGTIAGNTVMYSRVYGLSVFSVEDMRIYSNICDSGLVLGIYVSTSVESIIFNNTCSFNGAEGIYISESSGILVHSNECRLNAHSGIRLEYSSCIITANRLVENGEEGINAFLCGPLLVNWNTITANDEYGIHMMVISDSIVMQNILALNDDYGAYLSSCANVSVHHNMFVANNNGGIQASDTGSSTDLWYSPSTVEGNYWSDWIGAGPYYLDGDAGYSDLYPLRDRDSDSDTLPDSWEIANGLDPYSPDSDSDSLSDAWEVMYGLNPLENDTAGDLDADGLTNLREYILGMNPASNDTDGDLMPDLWEVQNYLNPLFDDAGLDPDGDGVSNLDEYLGGTSPHVSNSPPTTPTTTTTTTTTTTGGPTQPSGDILPILLAAIGGFLVATVLAIVLYVATSGKKAD